ncbi:MAG: (d)CMP kinase [Cyclobacteriaceae bacterium]
MRKIIIAIDGYSGCGKSSTAKTVAKSLNYTYLDSGSMYRAATLHFLNHYTNINNPKEVHHSLEDMDVTFHFNEDGSQEIFLNGLNVEKEIRSMEVSDWVSEVSKLQEVREFMVQKQRKMGKNKAIVMDGRDIGTVVFPEAGLKVFMIAELEIRASRRQKELLDKGELVALDKVKKNLEERDAKDTGRKMSPLKQADDAVVIDTSFLQFEEQVSKILKLAKQRMI